MPDQKVQGWLEAGHIKILLGKTKCASQTRRPPAIFPNPILGLTVMPRKLSPQIARTDFAGAGF
jgi:hypothetical protein